MSKQGWESYVQDALKRLKARQAPTTSQPTQLAQPSQPASTSRDPATQLRAHQAEMQTRQREETKRQATELLEAEQENQELAAFLERLQRFLLKHNSPGLSSFSIQTGGHENKKLPSEPTGPLAGRRKEDTTYSVPISRTEWGWQIATQRDSSGESPNTNLMLCQDGTLWVTLGSTVYFDGSDGTGRHTLGHKTIDTVGLYIDIIPGVTRLLSELGLEWDGN